MIECVLAWIFLFVGIVSLNPDYFIESGAFAVASQIYLYRTKGGEG